MPETRLRSDKPILVTGGAGFIGSHLVRLLVDEGQPVRVLELPTAGTDHLPAGVELRYGDLRRPTDVAKAMRGCGVVLHLAANPNLWSRDPYEFQQVNYRGTLHVLDAARAAHVARVVHVSTESILASPSPKSSKPGCSSTGSSSQFICESVTPDLARMPGAYCRSKLLAERAAFDAARLGQHVVVVNPTVPIGPGDQRLGPLSRLICQFAHGRIAARLDGVFNLVDVRDAAAGIWAAALRGMPGQRYLLAGENWTFADFFAALAEATGRPAPTWRVPYSLALGFAFIEEQLCRLDAQRTPMATVTGVRLTRRSLAFDGSASAAALGLHFRPVKPALLEAVAWFASQGLIPAPTALPLVSTIPAAAPPTAPAKPASPHAAAGVRV